MTTDTMTNGKVDQAFSFTKTGNTGPAPKPEVQGDDLYSRFLNKAKPATDSRTLPALKKTVIRTPQVIGKTFRGDDMHQEVQVISGQGPDLNELSILVAAYLQAKHSGDSEGLLPVFARIMEGFVESDPAQVVVNFWTGMEPGQRVDNSGNVYTPQPRGQMNQGRPPYDRNNQG
jgi:hypothetical protein